MDLIPLVPAGRQLVERYGPSGFRIAGIVWRGPVLVFPDATQPWAVVDAAAVTRESLLPIVAHGGVRILLLGLGRRMTMAARGLRFALRTEGIAIEPMDTGAACRTYNVLVAEERRVAAALIPPG